MASLDVIRNLTIRAKTEGVDESAASMDKLKTSTEGVANASVKLEKSTTSIDAALARTQRTIDSAAKAQQDLAKTQQVLNQAREAGRISQEEQAKLMQQAIVHFNSASSAAKQHSQVLQELSGVAQGLSSNLGPVGGILARIGPAGLAVAAGIGATVGIFAAASVAALKFADDMGKLGDTAETVGFTVEQLRALQMTAGEVGVSADQLDSSLGKFTAFMGQLRDGSKSAIEAANRLAPGLAEAGRSAKDNVAAFDLFTKALRDADVAGKALGAKEIFGKGGLGMARVADAVTTLDELAASMNKLDVITGTQAKTWDDLGDRIGKNMKLAGDNVKSSFATPVLEALSEVSKIALEASRAINLISGGGVTIDLTPLENFRVELQLLQIEIKNFGTAQAVVNLSDRLFGTNFTGAAEAVIATIKAMGSAFVDLINIISSAIAALASFATFDLSGALRQVESAKASFANIGTTISNLGGDLEAAAAKIKKGADATAQSSQQVATDTKGWLQYGIMLEKIGEITPPVSDKVKTLGAAHEVAGKAVKAHKEATEKLDPVLKELGQVAGQLGSSLVSAFLKGDNAAKALKGTLQSISSSAASSAINKLVTGDFSGAAVSGAISVGAAIGSFLFGDDSDKKEAEAEAKKQAEAQAAALEQLRQAQDAFAKMADQIAAFNLAVSGLTEGTLPKAIRDILRTGQELQDAAVAAHDDAAVQSIGQAASAGVVRLLNEFATQLPEMFAEFGQTDGPLANARKSINALMSQFDSLNDSISEFGRRTGNTFEELHAQVTESAAKALHSALDAVVPLSETAQAVADAKAKVAPLIEAFIQLGVSAEDAATVVDQHLNAALARLTGDFLAPLIRDVNRLAGADYINTATDLLAQVAQLNSDAAALGLHTALIQEFFIRSAQDIVDQNQLVGASFQILRAVLGPASDALHEFNGQVQSATNTLVRSAQEIANAIQANEDRLFNALHRSDSLEDQLARFDLTAQREREAEIAAGGQALASLEAAQAQDRLNIILDFQQQQAQAQQQGLDDAQRAADEAARILKEAVDFLVEQVKRIHDFISDFLSGPQSILKPSEQLAEAQSHFADELALAASGNRDSLTNITGNASNVIDAIRRYFGSGATGQGMIQQVLDQLEALPAMLTPEEFIVDGLTTPIDNVSNTVTTQTQIQTDILAALLENLKGAFATNNAQAFAIALQPLFETLDATMDGALSFDELKIALGTAFDTGTLNDIFRELDGNGNGLLEKSEVIKAATLGTESGVSNSLTLLDYLRSIDMHVSYCDHLATILTYLIGIANWAPGSNHAKGGWISGGIPGQDSVLGRLMPGEFVVREAVARRNPWLESFNQSGLYPSAANDNGSVVIAIQGLERSLLRGIAALIEVQLQSAGIISRPIEEANKLQRTRRGEKKKAA